jgi:hypothetical protein
VRYQDEQFSPDNNPSPRAGVGPFVDPQQLVQLLMAARAAQQMGQSTNTGASFVRSPSPGVGTGDSVDPRQLSQWATGSVLRPTDPFAAGAGSLRVEPLPNAGPAMALEIQKLPYFASQRPPEIQKLSYPKPAAKAMAIQDLRQPVQTNPRQGSGATRTRGSATGRFGVTRPPIPLGGSPPPPGVPANAFDQNRINNLTVEQIAGIVFNENRDVKPLPGRSTPEDLKKAKTAQAHAAINADRKYGKKRDKRSHTAWTRVPDSLKDSEQFQQALDAARSAYQNENVRIDPTGGRTQFNNRFEKDVGQDESGLRKDRVVTDKKKHPVGREHVFQPYGPFTVGGGRVWTVIYDDGQPIKSNKQAPPKKTGQHHTTDGKIAPGDR